MKLNNLFASVSVALAASLPLEGLMANPSGAQIVNGQVTFSQPNQNTLQVNNSHGAIINWQDFSINAGELTHFQQSGANSAVLNQVIGNNVSNIFGSLTSNGQVYLINPAGIVFGQNSIINTSGFIASTLNLSNQDFINGKLNFNGVGSGDILNQGYITAGAYGDIALIAPNITNEGTISVEQGDVILAAGEKVTLASLDASAVGFEVQSSEHTVTNLGSVTTDGGAVGMFAGSLKHSGVISATALSRDENGSVILVAKNNLNVTEGAVVSSNGEDGGRVLIQNENGTTWLSGTVEANGENGLGGVVDVLGEQVGLIDNASISTDGTQGGGDVHIGGNYQGKGPLQNASGTFVGENVSISANAIESGNGGEVIVWADNATRVYGSISATGGELFGNGGFVETSGKAYLDVTGIVLDLIANNGENGEWLLDPFDLTIGSGGDQLITAGPNFSSTGSGSVLNVDTLVNLLNLGTSVTINTGVAGAELGNITVATPIAVTGATPVSLTLDAENDINVNFSITSTNAPLNLTLNADSNYNLGADGIGQININALMNTNGGNVSLNAGDGITFNEFGDVTSGLGTISIFTAANDISLGSQSVDATDLVSSADIIIDAGGSFVMNNAGLAPTVSSGNNNISIVANDIVVTGTINAGTGNLLISSTPGIDMSLGAAGFGLSLDATEFSLINGGAIFLGQAGIGAVDILATLDSTVPLIIEGANINFNHTVSSGISSSADVSLITTGSINGNALALLDIIAPNIDLTSGFGIGDVDPLEIQLNITPGQLTFNNTANNVDIINSAASPSDVMRVTGDNTGVGGSVIIQNDLGITDVTGTGVTSNDGLLELSALQINVNALLDNNNFGAPVAMKLLGDVIDITANIFSASGGLILSNLSNGWLIDFNETPNGDLNFSQAEIDLINAFSIDFGSTGAISTSDMIFTNGMDFGAMDVAFNASADIQFSQGANTAITTTGNVKLDSGANIVGQAANAVDIVANQLDFLSGNGFGDFGTDAIEVNVGLLAGDSSGGSVYIDSSGTLTTGLINSTSSLPVIIEADGDLTVATITTAGGSVILDTTAATNGTGGSIFDDGVASPNISGAYRAELYSENGVGTLADNFELSNINDGDVAGGGLFTSVDNFGDIFIDNVGGAGSTFDIQAVTTGTSGEVFIHNANQPMNLNASIVTTTGDITLESNSAINLIASLNAGGGSDVNVTLISGSGDVTINGGVLSSNAVNITNNVAGITFGSTGFVLSPTVNLSANGIIDDSAATSSIGNGSQVAFLNAIATGNINLTSAGNDADVVYLQSNTGNVSYLDSNDINLDQVLATGTASIVSGGEIFDSNGILTNITADTASVTAVNGIGALDGLETSLTTSLDFTNSINGTVHFSDQSVNNLQVFGTNNSDSTLDFTLIQSQNGSLTVPVGQTLTSLNTDVVLDVITPGQSLTIDGTVSVSNVNSQINLFSPLINVSGTGSVLATGTALNLSVLLRADDMDLLGTLNGGVGDLAIENFTNGNTISIGAALGDMNLSAADFASLTAGRIGIGQNGGSGNDAGSISIDGAVTFTVDTKLASAGDITFNQGAANGITSVANVELNTEGAIIDLSAGGYDVAVNGLAMFANNGIGATDAIDTQVTGLQMKNFLAGNIDVVNTSASMSIAFINQDVIGGAVIVNSSGDIDFIDNAIDSPGITSFNGDVTLVSGGSILDSGVAVSHIFGANSVTLNSLTGIGTIVTPITVEDIGAGGLSVSAGGANNVFVDHVIGSLGSDFIISAINAVSGQVQINNLNAAQDTRINGPVSMSGGALSIVSPSSMSVDGNVTDNGTGTIGLQVTGLGENLFINNGNVTSNGGTISLTADNDITFNSTGNINNAAGGLTSLFATNGVLQTLTTAGVIGGGDLNASALNGIDLSGNNNVDVLNLTTTNNSVVYLDTNNVQLGLVSAPILSGGVTITSSGAILDSNTGLNNISAQTIMLNSTNGVGTLIDPIVIEDVGTGGLSVIATTGDIFVEHIVGILTSDFIVSAITAGAGLVTINNLNAAQDFRVAGPVSINGGTLSFVSPSSMFVDSNISDTGAGTIGLQVTGVGDDLFINNGTVSSNGGTISLTADNDITLAGTGDIFNAGGLTSLFATNGVLNSLTAAGITGNGDLNASAFNGIDLSGNNNVGVLNLGTTVNNIVFTDNDVQLGLVVAPGGITINSSGAISDGNGASNNVTAQTLTLNAANGIGSGDAIETSVGNLIQFTNSNANNVELVNSDPNARLLSGMNSGAGNIDITFEDDIQLFGLVSTGGTLTLASVNGNIQDSNDVGIPTVNLIADNIVLSAANGVGVGGDSIETELTNVLTGSINITNSSAGNIEILNLATSISDIANFTASNLAAGGEVNLLNPSGISDIGNVSSTQGLIELKALEINLNGSVNNNDAVGVANILVVADEFDVNTGSINANLADINLETLTNGRAIILGGADDDTLLSLIQADVDAFSAVTISIGVMDTITPFGSGDLTVAGSLDFGAANVTLRTLGNINLNNGTVAGLSTTGLLTMATAQGITSDASTGTSLIAPSMSIAANTGIGSVNAIRTQTSNLTILNSNSNDLNVLNTGSLSLSDSANLAGAMSITSDNILTLTPNLGLGGTTGAIASTDLKLEGTNGLLINGVVSGGNVSLLSPNGIGINDVVTASGNLLIDSDTDSNGVGDLFIENITGPVLNVTAANMILHSAGTTLLATNGAVHVNSAGGMNLGTANDLNILGGDALGSDAYLSARGNMNFDVGGNIFMSSGTAANTRVSIFDAAGGNNNNLNMMVDGNVTMLAGNVDNSGAFITVANLDLNVLGNLSLTGGAGNTSPAIIHARSGIPNVDVGASLSLVPGTGTASPALIMSNNGVGYLNISFADCVGCADGLKFLEQPINTTDTIPDFTNFTTEPIVSSQEQLALANEEHLFELDGERKPRPRPDAERPSDDPNANNESAPDDEQETTAEPEPEPKVLVCR